MRNSISYELMKISDKFIESIYQYSDVIIQVGSLVYNPLLCTEKSDIDFVVVSSKENIEPILIYGNVMTEEMSRTFIEAYIKFSQKSNIDSVICKSQLSDVVVSFNILNPEFFSSNCRINMHSDNELMTCWKFWCDYEKNTHTKITSFDGSIENIEKIVRPIDNNYYLNRTPIGATINNKYYVGYYQDQILCGGQTKKCTSQFDGFNDVLFDSLSQRLLIDYPHMSNYKSIEEVEECGIGFHKCICRHDEISDSLKKMLIQKTLDGVSKWS